MAQSEKELLQNADNIAVIGCSEKEFRTSYQIAEYLQESGYSIIPVNPNYDQILGEKTYDSLQDVPGDVDIHIADIFRNKKFTAAMVDQVIERVNTTGFDTAVWTQLDVSSDEAREKAKEADLTYIENKCMMVEHQRLIN